MKLHGTMGIIDNTLYIGGVNTIDLAQKYKTPLYVFDEELSLIKEFIRFPQGFWQIGLQYYWEMQPWEESVFINRIKKYIEDIGYREEFLNEYFR